METPKQVEKFHNKKSGKSGGKITNLFEDLESHPHNEKSYKKQTQKPYVNQAKTRKKV
jgi:hypothetical protein